MINISIKTALFGVLVAVAVPLALAQLPMTNSAGVSLVRESAEDWSFDEQTNGAGITLQLTAAFDRSEDTANVSGVNAFVGHIDASQTQRNAAGVSWQLYVPEAKQ